MQTRCPVPGVVADSPASQEFAPGFMTDLMYKDLGLALAAASQEKLPMAMAALAREQYAAASRARLRPARLFVSGQAAGAWPLGPQAASSQETTSGNNGGEHG